MRTYILAFMFYTTAMIGVMLTGFLIYKKFIMQGKSQAKNMIKIMDALPLAPKKTLYVIKVKNERFLIASDMQQTTFLAKLSDDNTKKEYKSYIEEQPEVTNFQQERLNRIQKQFQELYNKGDETKVVELNEKPSRKDMIKKLLKDLNDTKSAAQGNY